MTTPIELYALLHPNSPIPPHILASGANETLTPEAQVAYINFCAQELPPNQIAINLSDMVARGEVKWTRQGNIKLPKR